MSWAIGGVSFHYARLLENEHRQELRNDLTRAIMNRGSALWYLRRLEEAVAAYDESIAVHRELVETEHRQELRNELALATPISGFARCAGRQPTGAPFVKRAGAKL